MASDYEYYVDPHRMTAPVSAHTEVDGKPVLNFGGCAYLGLAGSSILLDAAKSAMERYGVANSLPRRYGVSCPAFLDAEEAAASYFGTEAAFVCGAGYLASPLAIGALAREGAHLYIDEAAHHSTKYAAAASGRPVDHYPHLSLGEAAGRLRDVVRDTLNAGEFPLICVDGVSGAYGDIPPLVEYLAIAEDYDGLLYVDEAHAGGVLGEDGRGAVSHFKIDSPRVFAACTLSKAFSSIGGVIYGDASFIADVVSTPMARGSNAGCIPAMAAAKAAFDHVRQDLSLIQNLHANIRRLKSQLRGLGFTLADQPSAIAAIEVGSFERSAALQEALLEEEGIYVCHSTYTGTPPGGVIRLAAFEDHAHEDYDRLIDALRRHL